MVAGTTRRRPERANERRAELGYADHLGALQLYRLAHLRDTRVLGMSSYLVVYPFEVEGRVLIYIHKEEMLDAVAADYPARHYVMIDDRLRILAMMKAMWRDRLTTVFPRQGHYATDADILAMYAAADLTGERIGDLLTRESFEFLGAAAGGLQQERW